MYGLLLLPCSIRSCIWQVLDHCCTMKFKGISELSDDEIASCGDKTNGEKKNQVAITVELDRVDFGALTWYQDASRLSGGFMVRYT